MRIAVITPGILPVPPVKGGAAETLIEYYLSYNEINMKHDITVFSVYNDGLKHCKLDQYKKTRFCYLKSNSFATKVKRFIFKKTATVFQYNYYLDYFLHQTFNQLNSKNFDVIIVENRQRFALTLASKITLPLILHLHNDTLFDTEPDAQKILEKYSKVLTVSGYLKQRVDSILPTDKVKIVYNGIDLERFHHPDKTSISRQTFGFSSNHFVVVYTGRIESIKGIKELLEAFQLLSEHKEIKLLVVGSNIDGSDHENDFMKQMRRLASQLGNQVQFTGFQPYTSIPAILSICNLAVIPSICEDAFTMASLEDMAIGLPLIVTRSGGIPEAVDEECAIILERNETLVSCLAENILYLSQNKEKYNSMSLHAKKRSYLFDKNKYAEEFLNQLEDLPLKDL